MVLLRFVRVISCGEQQNNLVSLQVLLLFNVILFIPQDGLLRNCSGGRGGGFHPTPSCHLSAGISSKLSCHEKPPTNNGAQLPQKNSTPYIRTAQKYISSRETIKRTLVVVVVALVQIRIYRPCNHIYGNNKIHLA